MDSLWRRPRLAVAAGLVSMVVSAAGAQTPLTLRAAVAEALRHSPSLRAAAAAGQQAQAGVGLAEAGRRPRLAVSEGFQRTNNPVSVFGTLLSQRRFVAADLALTQLNQPAPINDFATRVSVEVPLFDARQSELQTKEARLEVAAASRAGEQARQAVVSEVIGAYYRLAASQAAVRIAASAAAAATSSLRQAQARYRAGMVVEADALTAQVYAAEAREALVAAEGQAAVAQAALNRALGAPQGAPVVLAPAGEAAAPGGTLPALLAAAHRLRPELQLERDRLARAGVEVTRARAAFLPVLAGAAAWEHDQLDFARGGGSNWTLGLTLQWQPYRGGQRHAAVAAAVAAQRRERARGDELRQGVDLEVRQAWYAGATAARQLQIAQQAAGQAAAALAIVRNRYNTGLATITDLLAAETALTRARNQALQAGYELQVSAANRALAAGELTPNSALVTGAVLP